MPALILRRTGVLSFVSSQATGPPRKQRAILQRHHVTAYQIYILQLCDATAYERYGGRNGYRPAGCQRHTRCCVVGSVRYSGGAEKWTEMDRNGQKWTFVDRVSHQFIARRGALVCCIVGVLSRERKCRYARPIHTASCLRAPCPCRQCVVRSLRR